MSVGSRFVFLVFHLRVRMAFDKLKKDFGYILKTQQYFLEKCECINNVSAA